jgi:ABC-type branched-subunit amino acid transport system permease subunit
VPLTSGFGEIRQERWSELPKKGRRSSVSFSATSEREVRASVEQFVQFFGNGLTAGAIYALMAAGRTLVFGYMNVVNFAHGEFHMIGAYLAFTLHTAVFSAPAEARVAR